MMQGGAQGRGRLSGKSAIVTGGSRGIGAAIATAFAMEGATVLIVHLNDDQSAQATLDTLRRFNPACWSANCDISDQQQVISLVEVAVGKVGRIDILVNCAGIGIGDLFENSTLEQWDLVLKVNLTGAYLMSRQCYPMMKEAGSGRIINIASQKAFVGCIGGAAYCASKAGLIGMSRALALEAAPFGVLVNCIAPGATMTDMLNAGSDAERAELLRNIPLGRFARPEEIASTAVLLASEDGSFYVGQTLSPNGGDVMR